MSLPREQCEQGLRSEEYLILEFLKAYPEFAFTAEGVQSLLPGFVQGEIILLNPGETLDKLVERGAVDREVIAGLVFYAIHQG